MSRCTKVLCSIGLAATSLLFPSTVEAQPPTPEVEVYGTLLPFFESVGTTGATLPGTITQATQVPNGVFSGINHERRFRMTSGTSMLGFRGNWMFDPNIGLVWQLESPAPIDGEGPSNWANRNSHAGFTGPWGSLIYGNWDTPMRWVTVTSINPIKGGYTGDMTAIIGSPGHSTPAWNADQNLTAVLEIPPNRAGFFRHEANSVQYWSPVIGGFSLRVMYAANEHRTAGIPPNTEAPLNPWLVSGYIGWDNDWLRLRYSAELHKDYFGTANLVGLGPGLTSNTSTDIGHLALASVKINAGTEYETRIVATGDYLSYYTEDSSPQGIGTVNEFTRAAVYGLVQQTLGGNNIWLAYGQAMEGTCAFRSLANTPCTTTGLGAQYFTLGYMYEFMKGAGVYLLGYGLFNDVSARYTPFPLLESRAASDQSRPNIGEISHGSDSIGVGLGFVYSFNVKILGGPAAPPPPAEPKAAEAPKRAPEPEPESKPEPEPEPDPTPTPESEAAEEPAPAP